MGLTPVFLSIHRLDDGKAAERVTELMGDTPCVILRSPMSSGMTIGVMSRMTVVVSMRLHGLIFAAGQGVPLVGISYDPKVAAFMDYIGQGPCMKLDEVRAETLMSAIDRAAAQSGDRDERREAAEKLRETEQENVRAAESLLG